MDGGNLANAGTLIGITVSGTLGGARLPALTVEVLVRLQIVCVT